MRPILLFTFLFPALLFAQWTPIASYPGSPNDGCISFTINGKAYVGAGLQRADFYEYNPVTDIWTAKAQIGNGTRRAWAAGFSISGKGYVLGGDSTTSGVGLLNDFWEYDPLINTWSRLADYPAGGRDGMMVWPIGDEVFVAGGFDGTSIRSDIYKYNTVDNTWTFIGNLPKPVLFGSSFSFHSSLYFVYGDGSTNNNELWEYNTLTVSWEQKQSCILNNRSTAICQKINNNVVIGLGQKDYTGGFNDFSNYNIITNTWSSIIPDFPNDFSGWATSFVIGDTLFVGMGAKLPSFSYTNKFYRLKTNFTSIPKIEQDLFTLSFQNGNLFTNAPKAASISLYTVSGAKLTSFDVKEGLNQNALPFVAEGIYFALIQTEEGVVYQKILLAMQ